MKELGSTWCGMISRKGEAELGKTAPWFQSCELPHVFKTSRMCSRTDCFWKSGLKNEFQWRIIHDCHGSLGSSVDFSLFYFFFCSNLKMWAFLEAGHWTASWSSRPSFTRYPYYVYGYVLMNSQSINECTDTSGVSTSATTISNPFPFSP